MKMEYNFKKIEKKWQKAWEEKNCFEVGMDNKKPKYYVMEMFPYPSASGLHLGHALNYTIGDILARFKRMNGFNVLYPMGFDALGLPAENAAIKAGVHPKKFTENAIKNYIKQMKNLGLSYDWSKMISSMEPEYYQWNQLFFLKFLEKGLAYRKKAAVNWCGKCNTVLANEQVHQGKCWRHEDTDVEIKHLEQWFLKTTAYADELLDCIDGLKWPEAIKIMQKNWIGKSYGAEILFDIENSEEKISNVVIVHGCPSSKKNVLEKSNEKNKKRWRYWVKKELDKKNIICETPEMPTPEEPRYVEWKREFEKIDINENSILIGHSAGGGFLVRWLGETKKKIKKLILVAPAIIHSCEWHALDDLLKFKINKNVQANVKEIVLFISEDDSQGLLISADIFEGALNPKIKKFKNKGHFTEKAMDTIEFPELLNEIITNKKWPIFTTRPDTIFGVTFMVISAQHSRLMEFVTKEQKKEVEKFLKKLTSVSEKVQKDLEKEGVFTGSYAVNPAIDEKVPIYAGNFVVADYGSGMVMAVPAHDQRDFEFAKKYGIEIKEVIQPIDFEGELNKAYTGKGRLINSGKFDGLENEKAKEEITKWLAKKNLAKKTVQFKLRDWLISRQRYWGTPIPIVYCEKCGIVPVTEKDLPVKLPEKVTFGKGNPLATNKDFVNVKCPKCNGKARREIDTMDTFVDSSWYYMRYPDPHNDKVPFDKKIEDYWLPVDQYIGGIEHATMHLLYARFWTKALRDLGYVKFDEPFLKLFNQGMLHGSDGEKMSKSKGNVILPEVVSEKYGIDTARFFLMSLAAPDKARDWSDSGVEGSLKFINKVMSYFDNVKIGKSGARIESKLNKTIKEVTDDIDNFRYNLAVIKIRELFNSFSDEESKDVLEKSLKLLHVFCPHITEELWEKLGNKTFLSLEKWPKVDESKIDEKIEEQDKMIDKLVSDILNVVKIVEEKDKKEISKVYVYVLPTEKEFYTESLENIKRRVVKDVVLYSVSDKERYDPENKSKKVKPGRPGVYLE